MNKNYTIKLTRLCRLLYEFSSGKVYLKDMASELNVSIRTLHRDIESLREANFPIISENGSYKFTEGFSLNKTKLSLDEISALVLMGEISKPLGAKFEQLLKNIQGKLLHPKEETPWYVKLPKGARYPVNAISDAIETAITIQNILSISYAKTSGKAVKGLFHPYKLTYYEGFWYLVASDAKENIHKFRLDKITEVLNTGKRFTAGQNIQKQLEESTNIWFKEQRSIKIKIKAFPEVANYFKIKTILPLQKIVKENADGSLIIESCVSQNREAIHCLMPWIGYVGIISPAKLKAELKSLLDKGIARL